MTRRWLAPGAHVVVEVEDRSRFGSPLTTRPDAETRTLFAEVVQHVEEHGVGSLGSAGPTRLRSVVSGPAFGEIADRTPGGWCLHDDVLFPSGARFATLHIGAVGSAGSADATVSVDVGPAEWAGVHQLVAELHGAGAPEPAASTDGPSLTGPLLAGLEQIGALVDERRHPPASLVEPGLTFLGHNTVVVRSERAGVVLDPFLPAWAPSPGAGPYRPLTVPELGRIDAIAITHSHPDHFDPGTLLRFPRGVKVVVPVVERETLLAVAMAERVRELGFTDVVELPWWGSVLVGDIEIHALPFFGEQPTDDEWLHGDVRNAGNTYVIAAPQVTSAYLADSGRDHLGDSRELGAMASRRGVPTPDVVFSGYRAWRVYPAQHLLSSVARYALFVPPSRWSGRMQLMNGFDEALDVAERWAVPVPALVPYADGGAPWYWERGLGPRLDDAAAEVVGFDPFPERIFEHARARSATARGDAIPSPVDITLLRPNESLTGWATPGGPRREVIEGNSWPFGDRTPGSVG